MTSGTDLMDQSEEPTDTVPDEDLARRVQCGDGDAFAQLARRYVRSIHAILASYLSEPADVEDAGQETFLRALRGIEAYDAQRPFAPWLYQIARNVARNEVSHRARWQGAPPSMTLPSPVPGPELLLERSNVRSRVRIAMAGLPERQRIAFYLTDVEGYSSGEVAKMMDLSAGTVRSHLHHARRALRLALSDSAEQVRNTGG